MASNHKHFCSICLEDFTQPKILPCYHTFCLQCLDDHIKVQTHLNKFNCPICRKETEIPNGGASGFTTNFYIEDIHNQQTCPKHKKLLLDLYCCDCSTPICYKCNVIGHENHKKADLDEVGIEAREKLATLKQKLEKEVEDIKTISNSLTQQITNINNSSARACDDVDKQVKKICNAATKQGEDVKQEVIKMRDEECEKLRKLQEELNKFENQLQTSLQSSDDVLKREATIPVLDILPKVQTLADVNTSRSLDYPLIRHPDFPSVLIDPQSLKQQVGKLKVVLGAFTSIFDTSIMKVDEYYYNKNTDLQEILWLLRVIPRNHTNSTKLCIYLYLLKKKKKGVDVNVNSCSTSITVTLVNRKDEKKSVVKTVDDVILKPEEMCCSLDNVIDWDFLLTKDNNFLDDENKFALEIVIRETERHR